MKIIIHRGTHQIGGIATEIRTETTRIIIDMGDELSLCDDFVSAPLNIAGVTDNNGICDAVLFTHYHGDHTGQMLRVRDDVPMYMGTLAKDIMLTFSARVKNDMLYRKIDMAKTFREDVVLPIGDIRITPYSVDHSASDSYFFLIEADGKRILYTGDFRMHGFRGKAIPKILRKIGKVDVLIVEGTTLSRNGIRPMSERELQQKVKAYMSKYKYVYVLCASTNLERMCGLAKLSSKNKRFICDTYQSKLLELMEQHWGHHSELYRNLQRDIYSDDKLEKLREDGFLMAVRDNWQFRNIIKQFDPAEGIILYSMWDGYRTKPNSSIPAFLNLAGTWESLHSSGHITADDILEVIRLADPDIVVPIHTEVPDKMRQLCPNRRVEVLSDGQELIL